MRLTGLICLVLAGFICLLLAAPAWAEGTRIRLAGLRLDDTLREREVRVVIHLGRCGNEACDYRTPAIRYVQDAVPAGSFLTPTGTGGHWNNAITLDIPDVDLTREEWREGMRWKASVDYVEFRRHPGRRLRAQELSPRRLNPEDIPSGGAALGFLLPDGRTRLHLEFQRY